MPCRRRLPYTVPGCRELNWLRIQPARPRLPEFLSLTTYGLSSITPLTLQRIDKEWEHLQLGQANRDMTPNRFQSPHTHN